MILYIKQKTLHFCYIIEYKVNSFIIRLSYALKYDEI